MARQTMSGVKKKAAAKSYAPQTVALTWALSAQKAASGEGHIAPGEGNHPPVATTASTTSQASVLAPALARPAVPDVVQDPSPDAATDVVTLQGEYSTCLMHMSY